MRAVSGERLKKPARVLVLGAFAILLAVGRIGFWAAAFVLGLVMEAVKPGRLYCMRLCPIRAAHGLSGRGSGKTNGGAPLRRTRSVKNFGRAFIAAFLVLFGISSPSDCGAGSSLLSWRSASPSRSRSPCRPCARPSAPSERPSSLRAGSRAGFRIS
ncbi:MAG: hypothetical protein MZV70_69670 [Desulfobacterales bacterium]|nr:hypothetical protein [Desulfobacterales bacterium]